MAKPLTPSEVFGRAVDEGQRRLDQSLLELVSTSVIAGFTIVFGIVALGIVHATAEAQLGELTRLVGGLAFAIGLVFLIVGRAELFSENFFDPIATAFSRHESGIMLPILRLWGITFILNLVGGAFSALVISVDGVLPSGTEDALRKMAEEIAARGPWVTFVSAVMGGALVALLSFFLAGADSTGSRIVIAYLVGFLVAIGPFDHSIITALHLFLGIIFDASVGLAAFAGILLIVTIGNIVGGVGLVTLSLIARARGAHDTDV